MVFLFLYRQSKVVYFGLWAVAWVMRVLATFFGFQLLRTQHSGWLAPYATFEFAFAIVLISAARAGFASSMKDWRTVLRLIAILPIFVALVWAIGQFSGLEAYHASHAVVLGFVYMYNFFTLRKQQRPGRADLPLLAAGAGGGVLRARRHSAVPVQSRRRAGVGACTCTTRPISISRCTACWPSPPWRCGVRARSTACAT